jgi:Bacteriophage Sf6, terminase small subunit-like
MTPRATVYTAEIAERILTGLKNGRSLRAVCKDEGMPAQSTARRWILEDREGFAARYKEAREIGNPGMRSYASVYTDEIAEHILGELRRGRGLSIICGEPGMPAIRTVTGWVKNDRDGFAARYSQARAIGNALMARFTLHTPEIVEHLLGELCCGRTLTDVCGDPDMPSIRTVQQWVTENREGFKARYDEARQRGYQVMSDRLIDIADDSSNDRTARQRKDGGTELVGDPVNVKRGELRCKVRQWLLAKMLPRTFGDGPTVNTQHEGISDLAELMKQIDGRSRGLPSQRLLPKKVDDG